MILNARPIMSALLRNRTGAVLVALQIALALAILVNATYLVKEKLDAIHTPSGVDDANLFALEVAGFTGRYNYEASVAEDMAYLRGLDGVIDATPSNAIPLSNSGSTAPLYKTAGRRSSDVVDSIMYEMDEHGLQTLGTHLIAGRAFRKEEILPPMTPANGARPIPVVIVTQALAKAVYPDGNALGKPLYDPFGRPVTIIGIVANMSGVYTDDDYYKNRVFFAPQTPYLYGFTYLVRTKPGRRDALMRIATAHLVGSNVNRVIETARSVETYARKSYQTDRTTALFLAFVTCLLLAVAALGIFGLATFNVSTRTKQIGTRRAVGARKGDIVQYFLVENGLITTTGIVIGCALALGVGYWLSVHYNLARLDLYFLVGGVLSLWVIGQLAAWQPARRAATVSPSVATRTA
jgi:putative ABC transport system permease protein